MSKKSSKMTEATATKTGTSKDAAAKGAKKTKSTTAKTGKATKASTKPTSHKRDAMEDMGVDIFDFTIIDFEYDVEDDFEQESQFVDPASCRNRRF